MFFRQNILPLLAIFLVAIVAFSNSGGMELNMENRKNIHGTSLNLCCQKPMTGFHRDGYCAATSIDPGQHVVCAVIIDAFLDYTKKQNNDLSTPKPEYNFPGLKAGDRWCLCASRWMEAYRAGVAPMIDSYATDEIMLEYLPYHELKKYFIK